MSSDIVGSIILLAVLLSLSIYFSATETSITAAGKGKLLALSDEYPHRKRAFLWLVDNTAKAINVTLIGNNLVNIAASAVATSVAITVFGKFGPVFAVAVMTFLIVVFCEILPKNFAIAKKEGVLLTNLPPASNEADADTARLPTPRGVGSVRCRLRRRLYYSMDTFSKWCLPNGSTT